MLISKSAFWNKKNKIGLIVIMTVPESFLVQNGCCFGLFVEDSYIRICHHGPNSTNYIEIHKSVVKYNVEALVVNLPPVHNCILHLEATVI
jgi:hypothetical protein